MVSFRDFILYFLIRILRSEKIPQHIAFIPDNNRTFAKRRKIDLLSAYLKGGAIFYKLLKLCTDLKTSNVSVYLLSTHNLKRNEYEKQCVFDAVYILLQKLSIQPLNCRVKIIGDISVLSHEIQELCTSLSDQTRDNDGIILNIVLNYSGKEELIDVAHEILHQLDQSKLNLCQVDENLFDDFVYTKPSSDVDLVIRTSTDKRLSEFLLWQISKLAKMKHSGQKKNLHFSIALFIIYQLSSVKCLNEKTQPYSVINMAENTESSEQTNEELPQVSRRGYAGEDFYQKASKNIPRMGRRGLRSDSEDEQNAILEFDNKVKRPYTKLQLPEESLWPWDSDRVPQHLKRTNFVEHCRQWPRMEKFVNDLEFCSNNLACCSPIKDSSILKRFLQTYSSKQTSPRPNYKNNQYMK